MSKVTITRRNQDIGTRNMPLDENAYSNLEQQFRGQVIKDRSRVIQWVVKQGLGVYLPCVKPKDMVDYIFVGMEPSFGWADSVEDGEKKVEEGFTNFAASTPPDDAKHPLDLMNLSIERFLCKPGETYYLTDVSKGAMPVAMADIDREQRYKEWYPLLLEEIDIVGKPDAPIIAIGKQVEKFLRQNGLEEETGQRLHDVVHYSPQAVRAWKREAERDQEGFEAFKKAEFGEMGRWAKDLALSRMQLVFTYKKQFEGIVKSHIVV